MTNMSVKKNAILNVIKQVLKIAFPLITFPYVSRILLDENLGKYNFAQSVVSYFILIAGLGIASYAIREGARIRDDKEKLRTFACEVFTINVYSSLLSYALLIVLCLCWNKLDNCHELLIVQSSVILFNTLGADWVNTIFEDYEYMTKRYIFIKILSLVFIFSLIRNRNQFVLYAAINAGSEIAANIMNIFHIRRYTQLRLTRNPKIRQHILPLIILFTNSLAVTIYTNSDITMLGIFQGDSEVLPGSRGRS